MSIDAGEEGEDEISIEEEGEAQMFEEGEDDFSD
jgi:hypothetical protein